MMMLRVNIILTYFLGKRENYTMGFGEICSLHCCSVKKFVSLNVYPYKHKKNKHGARLNFSCLDSTGCQGFKEYRTLIKLEHDSY